MLMYNLIEYSGYYSKLSAAYNYNYNYQLHIIIAAILLNLMELMLLIHLILK